MIYIFLEGKNKAIFIKKLLNCKEMMRAKVANNPQGPQQMLKKPPKHRLNNLIQIKIQIRMKNNYLIIKKTNYICNYSS